jgi:hypothetical protein
MMPDRQSSSTICRQYSRRAEHAISAECEAVWWFAVCACACVRTLRFGVFEEALETIDEVRAIERVTANTDARALSESHCTVPAQYQHSGTRPPTHKRTISRSISMRSLPRQRISHARSFACKGTARIATALLAHTIAMAVAMAIARHIPAVVCPTASYVRVPDRETIPIFPGRWILAGIIPILHLTSGRMMPGQLGPIRRVFDC